MRKEPKGKIQNKPNIETINLEFKIGILFKNMNYIVIPAHNESIYFFNLSLVLRPIYLKLVVV
jgi:hypothetical protein